MSVVLPTPGPPVRTKKFGLWMAAPEARADPPYFGGQPVKFPTFTAVRVPRLSFCIGFIEAAP